MKHFVLAALVFSSMACGGSSPITPGNENISGSWAGFSNERLTSLHLAIAHNGSSLGGTWTDDFSHGGTISGSKTDATVRLTLTGNATSCSLSYTGGLSSLSSISGTIVGLNCNSNVGGALILTKVG